MIDDTIDALAVTEFYLERASILEYDGGLDRDRAEVIAWIETLDKF